MKILTYHGDETITRLFTTLGKAMDYAVAEVMDCTSVEMDEIVMHVDRDGINEYADAETIEAVILDQSSGDFRIYTVEDANIDEEYTSKFS